MKKKVVIVFMMMSLFSVLLVVKNNTQEIQSIKEIVCILVVLGVEVSFSLLKRKEVFISIVEIILLGLIIFFKIDYMIYFFPIIVFKVCVRLNIRGSTYISAVLILTFSNIDYFNILIYIIIINLYLNEVLLGSRDKSRLKEKNKNKRDENHRMKGEIRDLERYLEQNKIIVGIKERNFMTQKLHDHLGHRITSSLMQLEVTKETMDLDKEVSKKYLDTAMENLRVGMDEIRKMLKGVKPKENLLGIENIREQILKFQYSSRIKANLKVQGDLEKIGLDLWSIIEENLNESLTNVSKYSEGSLVTVSILVYNKILRVEVRDNGKGSKFKEIGLGLRGIQERTIRNKGRVEYFNDNGFVINTIFEI